MSKDIPNTLESQEQLILKQMYKVIGDDPVSEAKLQFAPRWIIDKTIQKEKDNYTGKNAYGEVNIKSLPEKANLISSHCFIQIKTDGESSKLKLKCRLVPHGNRDKEKDYIRKDSATAQFPVIRALLSAAVLLNFRLATIDTSGAYLQEVQLNRDVYVRLPPGWAATKFTTWKLLVPAYGLVKFGRLWQLAVEECMRTSDVHQIPGMPQIFTKQSKLGRTTLIIAKVVDDFLIAGMPNDITRFHEEITQRFKVGRFVSGTDLVFDRLHISQDKGENMNISMQEYFDKIEKIPVDRNRRKQEDSKCTEAELRLLQTLAGQLNWLGHGVLPPAAYVSSLLQQWTGDLRVRHLNDANRALHALRRLTPILKYNNPKSSEKHGRQSAYLAFSDASQGKTSYGQTGYISGIFIFSSSTYHVLE